VISHNYFQVDAEVIYHVCLHYMEPMALAIEEMIKELS
jgi:hypothetical protein